MIPPWQTRKLRRRQEAEAERLEALREARDAALSAVEDAKASGCTQRQGNARIRVYAATHALRRAEMEARR